MIAKLLAEHHFELKDLELKRRLHMLVQDYTCQNVKLLETSCPGSHTSRIVLDYYSVIRNTPIS